MVNSERVLPCHCSLLTLHFSPDDYDSSLDRRRPAEGKRKTDPVLNPWTGRELARLAVATAGDLERAILGAKQAFEVMRVASRPSSSRHSGSTTAALLRRDRAALGRLMAEDAGKPVTLALGEVDRAITTFTIASESLRWFGGEAFPADVDPRGEGLHRADRQGAARTDRRNFAVQLSAQPGRPQSRARQSRWVRRSSSRRRPQAPLLPFRLAELLTEAGLPAGALQVLHMPIPVAERLATDSVPSRSSRLPAVRRSAGI